MRILHVIPSFAPAWRYGGPVRAAYEMCRALAQRGHDVTVMTTDIDGDGRLTVPTDRPVAMDGFKARYFPIGSPRGWCYSRELGAALDAEVASFDAVHIHSMFLYPTTAASRSCARHGVPYLLRPAGSLDPVCLEHRYEPGLRSMMSRLKKAAYFRLGGLQEVNRAHALHFTSRSERERSADPRFRAAGITIPLGVRPEESLPGHWDALLRRAEGRKILLYLSRLDPKKGLDVLIPALSKLAARRSDFLLAVAGDGAPGERGRLEATVAAAGLEDRVVLLGRVDDRAKWSLFEAADVFILPSHHENFGLAAAEALAAGVPCILSRGVAIAADAAVAGAAVDIPLTREALAGAIERLLDDDALRARMGAAGRAMAARQYSWPEVARRLEEMYASMSHRQAAAVAEVPA